MAKAFSMIALLFGCATASMIPPYSFHNVFTAFATGVLLVLILREVEESQNTGEEQGAVSE